MSLLGRLAPAAGVSASAIDIRRLLHSRAFGAAILARRCHARTNGMCTLLGFRSRHFVFPIRSRHFFLASDQQRLIQGAILDTGENHFCPIRNTFQCGSQRGNHRCGW